MKKLPRWISHEFSLDLNYCIARYMKSKVAHRIEYNQRLAGEYCTIKLVEGDALSRFNPLIHLHIRKNVQDRHTGDKDILDIDIYIPLEDFWPKFNEMTKQYK